MEPLRYTAKKNIDGDILFQTGSMGTCLRAEHENHSIQTCCINCKFLKYRSFLVHHVFVKKKC